jgi:Putative prokaryotic signal transducing protein
VEDLATVDVVRTEGEAELICSLLKTAGITCMHRPTNWAAGVFDGMAVGGPREVVVNAEDLAAALEVVDAQRETGPG